MNPVSILLFTGMHQRYRMSELFAKAIERFIADAPGHFHVKVFAVVTDERSADICRKHNFYYVIHENNPLGKKFNFGLRSCTNIPFDYLLITGDDDLWNSEAWEYYKEPIKKGIDYFGFRECYFYSTATKEALHFRYPVLSGKIVGCGRMISRKVIEKMDWKLWEDERENRMDGSFDKMLASQGVFAVQLTPSLPVVTDVKSGTNIWPFEHLEKFSLRVKKREALSFLSKKEKRILNKL